MMSQAEALYHLQQIDLQIMRNRKRLEEIAAALQDRSAITQAERRVESVKSHLTPLRTQIRDLELEIQSNAQKTQSTEDRLYSGNVKNPKELQDMQQEIGSLKRRKGQLEDRLLELMVEAEETEEELNAQEDSLKTVTTEWEDQHSELLEEQANLQAEQEKLREQREEALQPITEENRKLYNQMKSSKANQPVAALEGQSCSACGMEQTMTIQQEVRRGHELVKCLNCGRILADVRG